MTFSRTGHRLLRAAVAFGVGLFSAAGVAVPASRHHSDPHTMSSRRAVSTAVPIPEGGAAHDVGEVVQIQGATMAEGTATASRQGAEHEQPPG